MNTYHAIVIIYILFLIVTLHAAYINAMKGNPKLALGNVFQAMLFLAMIIITYVEEKNEHSH